MKKLAKILSVVLCLAMVLSLAAVALAADATYTKVTSMDELKAGGKFVIIGDDKVGNYYAFGNVKDNAKLSITPVTIADDGTLSGENIPVWSIAAEGEGFSINNGTIYLGYESGTNIEQYEGGNPYAWTFTLRDNGCFCISEQAGKRAIGYRLTEKYMEGGAYALSNEDSSKYGYEYNFNLTIYKLEGSVADVPAIPEPKVPIAFAEKLETVANGDVVYMVMASEGKAVGSELKKDRGQYKMSSEDAVIGEDGKLAIYEDTAAAKVTVLINDDGTYSFTIDGKYLSVDNYLNLTDELTDAGKWILETAEGGYFIKSVVVEEDKDPQYLEYYQKLFTTYKMNADKAGIYTFSFYSAKEEPPVEPAEDNALKISVWTKNGSWVTADELAAIQSGFEAYLTGKGYDLSKLTITYVETTTEGNKVADLGAAVNAAGDFDIIIGCGKNVSTTGGVEAIEKATMLLSHVAADRYVAKLTENTLAAELYTYLTTVEPTVEPPVEPSVPETQPTEPVVPPTEPVEPGNPGTGDAFGIVVAMMVISGTALMILKKKEN